jgi:two-component system sensor histidine kinase KdpD
MKSILRRALIWLAAFAAIATVTAAGSLMALNASTVGFAYLIVVLLISLWGGLLVGTVASVIATLCYNFFFFPPLYELTIAQPANWFALAAFLISSVIVTRLVVAARVQAESADQRRNELEALYNLSVDLFTATNRVGALGEAAGRALQLLGAREGGLVLFDGSSYRQNVIWWSGSKPDEIEDLIAGVGRHKEMLEFPSPLGRDVYLPLVVGGQTTGALVARGTDASKQALQSAGRLVALAVERERFMEESAHMQGVRESEALKTSLLRAISHDLTTPLTAITILTEALRRRAAGDPELGEIGAGIAGETSRLWRRIDNLLAMARLEAGKAKPRPEPAPPADLFRAARENLPLVFGARPITVQVEADCPDAYVDPSLTLEILVNLVENAHRVSPAGAPIELRARRHPIEPGKIRLEILDRGPGLPDGLASADGTIRANETSDVAQRGLGLEIARSLATANGGTIGFAPREGGGTIARIDLPAALVPQEVSS